MYKIYFGKKQIILTSELETKETSFKFFFLEEVSANTIIEEIRRKDIEKLVLFNPNSHKLLELFTQKFPLVQACGGLVTNTDGKLLFIKRNGKWDLPKGKLEKGESLQECALREVQEEAGVKNLTLQNERIITYHIFERKAIFYLKQTHWYNMTSSFNGELIPQEEEGIEKVSWKHPDKLEKIYNKTYGNIIDVLKA